MLTISKYTGDLDGCYGWTRCCEIWVLRWIFDGFPILQQPPDIDRPHYGRKIDATGQHGTVDSRFNTWRSRENGRHVPMDILKWRFLDENVWIPINISMTFVPTGQINNIPTMVQIMVWRQLYEPMMDYLITHICVTRPQWVKEIQYNITWLCMEMQQYKDREWVRYRKQKKKSLICYPCASYVISIHSPW